MKDYIDTHGSHVFAYPVTTRSLIYEACAFTTGGKDASRLNITKMFSAEHSPIRAYIWKVGLIQIPTFVSVHLVRHKIGVEHYVQSNRSDRGGVAADRWTPVNHMMILNAQALITISRKRLCFQASEETRRVWGVVKLEVARIDSDMAEAMVPECIYRGRCVELKPCGRMEREQEDAAAGR